MDNSTRMLLGWGAIIAPLLHMLTDVAEWIHGGFTTMQLWVNYVAFLMIPAVMIGLYAVQRPCVSRIALLGALLYGAAFIYFAHTTLFAIQLHVPTYEQLWDRLGTIYPMHGAAMIVGAVVFGWPTLRAGVFPRWTAQLLLAGVAINLLVALLPVPDLLQTAGSMLRNLALAGMGLATLRRTSAESMALSA